MNYLSFFSGIGCFEYAIHQKFPAAHCLGFSEIDPYAIQVYTHHFPTHSNLGNIEQITETDIRRLLRLHRACDLVVGGFPCQDLNSMANFHGAKGLEGQRSGLLFPFLRVLTWIFKYSKRRPRIVIENNASMNRDNRDEITRLLEQHLKCPIYLSLRDGPSVGMLQSRRRLFWTNFKVSAPPRPRRCQTWSDVLLPERDAQDLRVSDRRIAGFNTLYRSSNVSERPLIARKQPNGWYTFIHGRQVQTLSRWKYLLPLFSDTGEHVARTIVCGDTQFLFVRKSSDPAQFRLRRFHPVELERLFGLPDGYVSGHCSRTRCKLLLGNAILVPVIAQILSDG